MGRSFFASWNVLFSREGEREVLQSPICNYVSLGTYCVLLVSGGLVTVRGSWVFFFFFPLFLGDSSGLCYVVWKLGNGL